MEGRYLIESLSDRQVDHQRILKGLDVGQAQGEAGKSGNYAPKKSAGLLEMGIKGSGRQNGNVRPGDAARHKFVSQPGEKITQRTRDVADSGEGVNPIRGCRRGHRI
jgi:hypothetical protein